ncbi:MAG: hypothetical protein COY68_04250 [Candidatus Levybacteria bacterium CG_4_10_14_0_8_um_filter_35_23]|nr:MAG: hypothetical protein COY68_04250 [Candidatus Levybacteria bacterium CG_4_10_14_0_8_um_filter_35_23]
MDIKPFLLREDQIKEFYSHFLGWIDLFSEYSKSTINFFKKEWTEDIFKERITDQIHLVLAVKVSDKPAGILIAKRLEGGVFHCDYLIVDSKFQRKGIGRALLSEWEQIAKKEGFHNIRMEAEYLDLEFYKKCGFEVIGEDKKGFYGTDNFILKKLIQEPREENFLK